MKLYCKSNDFPLQTVVKCLKTSIKLDILQQDIPHCDNMTDTPKQDEEMKHRVHVLTFVPRVKQRACDISHAFSNNPADSSCRHTVNQRLERYKHTKTHSYICRRLNVTVSLQSMEGKNRTNDGTQPNETEQRPSPQPLMAESNERDG